MTTTLYLGGCLEIMQGIPDASVGAVVCDPPYELGFMSQKWDSTGIAFRPDVWRECLRALKPGGFLLAFGGTRSYHRMACAIEDAGFVIKDSLHWVHGQGFPKSRDIGKSIDAAAGAERWAGFGTALKPSVEPVVLAQKPIAAPNIAANVLAHGVGALNIDATRVASPGPHGTAGRKKFADFSDGAGFLGRLDATKSPPNPLGRWPANLLLSHTLWCAPDACDPACPVALMDRQSGPRKAGGTVTGHEPSRTGQSGIYGAYGRVANHPHDDAGGASRFFPTFAYDEDDAPFYYCAKVSRSERNAGCAGLPGGANRINAPRASEGEKFSPSLNHHPTVKPLALMRWLVRLVAPPGAVVLDPFAGSCTTGLACLHEDRPFIGIEQNAEYCAIGIHRMRATALALGLPDAALSPPEQWQEVAD